MNIGTLVKTKAIEGNLGIVLEAYDSPKGLWYVYWLTGSWSDKTNLCNVCTVEVLCK